MSNAKTSRYEYVEFDDARVSVLGGYGSGSIEVRIVIDGENWGLSLPCGRGDVGRSAEIMNARMAGVGASAGGPGWYRLSRDHRTLVEIVWDTGHRLPCGSRLADMARDAIKEAEAK